MITIKDQAAQKRVTYEAVRKQINRYKEELGEHLIKQGRTQYLDDEGVAFLDEKRQNNPIIIFEHDKDEQIDQLQQDNEKLKALVAELQSQIIEKDNMVIKTQGLLLETNQQILSITQKSDEDRKQLDELIELMKKNEEEKQQLVQRLDEAENRSVWQVLFGKKKKKTEEQKTEVKFSIIIKGAITLDQKNAHL